MSNPNITDWLQWVRAVPIGKRKSYVELPSFNVTGLTWKGASEIVLQFNFSAAGNFYITALPVKPSGVNYGLCIRYRVGDTVFRYKLWDDTNFWLADAAVYAGQIIRKNFVLEVWSFDGQTTAVQTTAVRVATSPRAVPTDLRVSSDYSLATGASFSALANTNVVPSTIPVTPNRGWYKSDTGVTTGGGRVLSWANQDGAGSPALVPAAGSEPLYNATDVDIANKPSIQFDSTARYLSGSFGGAVAGVREAFIVISQLGWNLSDRILSVPNLFVDQDAATPEIRLERGAQEVINANFGLSSWGILNFRHNAAYISVGAYPGFGALQSSANLVAVASATGSTNVLGSLIGTSANFKIAEALFYTTELTTQQVTDTITYLAGRYGGIGLPLVFDSGSAWLDNT